MAIPVLLLFAALQASSASGKDVSPAPESSIASSPDSAALAWGPCPSIFPTGCEIAVLHGDPAKPNADVFLRIPGGYAIPAHRHTSAERMILVHGQLEVKYRGSPAAMLSAGDYAYGPAGLPHRAACIGEAPCTLFIAFEGPVDADAHNGPLD